MRFDWAGVTRFDPARRKEQKLTATSFEFDFAAHKPPTPLGRFVESLWYARGTIPYKREKIAPTGSTVAVFVLGDPIEETADNGEGRSLRADRGFLIGPHDRPVINEPTGETFAVGVVGTPVGCEALFGIRPSRLRGRAVDLETIWPAAAQLRSELLSASGPEEMLNIVEAHLAATYDPSIPGLDRCRQAVSMLEGRSTQPIADIAAELGISHGHLDREFTRIVGMSPRALARLLRLRRLLSGIDVQSEVGWADLAIGLGWFDQAHFIRDFKRHTGVTPSRYLEAQRSTYAPVDGGDASGFVPET